MGFNLWPSMENYAAESLHLNCPSQSTHHLRFSSQAERASHADSNKLNFFEFG